MGPFPTYDVMIHARSEGHGFKHASMQKHDLVTVEGVDIPTLRAVQRFVGSFDTFELREFHTTRSGDTLASLAGSFLAGGCIATFLGGLHVGKELRNRPKSQALNLRPPPDAEFLFYLFLDAQNCDALVGDLEERFMLIGEKFGQRRANFWYWTQALRSVGPIAWAWVKKVSVKPVIGIIAWAVARGLIGHDGWLVGLLEIWKRIRS
jgi:hypothetical protein